MIHSSVEKGNGGRDGNVTGNAIIVQARGCNGSWHTTTIVVRGGGVLLTGHFRAQVRATLPKFLIG